MTEESRIATLTYRWHDANNRRNRKEFLSFWTEDATFAAGEPEAWSAVGVERIAALYDKLLARFPFFFTMPHCPVIEVNGNEARARWHIHEVAAGPDSRYGMVNYGIYEDRLVKVDGEWRFKVRFFNYLFLSEDPLSGVAYPLTESLSSGVMNPAVPDDSIDPGASRR